ncbi:MAG: YidC/Oxa1 family membrane protein insertase, partial [Clostridiales bacterium]|nr:YidC/Oxa1 family membrane protein insertase [Clostridiales bacterium]
KTEEKIGPWQEKIKKTFKGDERFMMLQAFYRENNYKPTDALKGSLSLMLEIPFFIAAYRMLSSLKLLQGVKFGPIADLGAPDHMIVIGALAINLLPILMTLINIISSAIYTKGLPTKAKVQLYGMALIFLVFLYNSPAGLVFYWTLNNLFSLVKNIFYKLKNPRLILAVMSALAGVGIIGYSVFKHNDLYTQRFVRLLIVGILFLIPLAVIILKKHVSFPKKDLLGREKARASLFFFPALFMTVFTGLLIPSAVIESSVAEFTDPAAMADPVRYLYYSGCIAAGYFIIWFGFFYLLASETGKKIMGMISSSAAVVFVVDHMLFGNDLGTLSPSLKYEVKPEYSAAKQLINLAVLFVAIALVVLAVRFLGKQTSFVIMAACLAVAGMSVMNMNSISKEYKTLDYMADQSETPEFTLSREGQNVVIIMLDRALGAQIPYILNERPELMEQFDGFTYYPDTLSFGGYTIFGTPPLYGGYEYTPENMNLRSEDSLEVKHDEALRVMPYLFDDNGFNVTVCDPSYAGYKWTPDLSIYSDHPDINTYITNNKFNDLADTLSGGTERIRERNFFFYSIFRCAPLLLRGNIYNLGAYNEADLSSRIVASQSVDSMSVASGYDPLFMNAYSVLACLDQMTIIDEGGSDNFLLMTNDTTHEPTLLQEPDYTPEAYVNNTEFDRDMEQRYTIDGRTMRMDNSMRIMHYDVNMAALIQLGEWFDYLREQGVYDNTRIIIVSDHGRDIGQFDDMKFFDGDLDVEQVNPLLLVKDFDLEGFTVSDEFMTNGDVPVLAFDGLIEDPVNPFTGNLITNEDKYSGDLHVFHSDMWSIDDNNGNTFLSDDWYSVHDSIFEEENWEYLGFY